MEWIVCSNSTEIDPGVNMCGYNLIAYWLLRNHTACLYRNIQWKEEKIVYFPLLIHNNCYCILIKGIFISIGFSTFMVFNMSLCIQCACVVCLCGHCVYRCVYVEPFDNHFSVYGMRTTYVIIIKLILFLSFPLVSVCSIIFGIDNFMFDAVIVVCWCYCRRLNRETYSIWFVT